ncbi:MAG: hypothetical protein LM580_12785, partial [Thermofilum sp.]|nr:hypothetical protein [Thermofilum sp.]
MQDAEEYGSLEELIKELKGWSGGRVAVVPESSWEAAALKQMLEKEAPNLRVQLLYLPQLYREAAEGYSENVKNLAKVEHSSLGKAYGCEAEGYSSTLLREWGEQLQKLEEAKESILRLSPSTLGLSDYLRDVGVKALAELGAAVFGVPVALAMERVLRPVAQLSLSGAASALLDRVRKIPSGRVEELVSRVLVSLAKPEARDKVAEGLARFIASARGAARYLDGGWLEDALETVWDQVALEWGMDARNFKILVENFAKLAEGELVTREELGKLLEKAWEEVRKELEELRLKIKEVNTQLQLGIPLLYLEDVEKGGLYKNFVVRGGRPLVGSKEGKQELYVELVTAGRFEGLAGEVLRKLGGDGFMVLVGPKGVGKSALAAYAVWLALRDGFADAAVRVSGMERGESLKLKRLTESVDRGRLIAVYDPSPLHAYYEPGAYAHEVRRAFERSSVGGFLVEETLRELLSLKGVERVNLLVVLPDDIYQSLIERNPELKGELERYTLRVDLRDPLFLEEVVKAYSGCTGSFKELAESIAEFEGGYTLVAKYAGLTLREKECSVEDVRKALREARGKPKLFLAYYLWSVLLKGSGDLAMMAAVPLILHSVFGPIPEGVTYLVKAAPEGGRWRLPDPEQLRGVRLRGLEVEELKPLARWLSVLHEDLVEEALRELCSLKYRELKELTGALDWAWREILREEEKVPDPEKLPVFVGKRLEAALEAYATSCWRRLALVAGSALAWQRLAPLVAASQSKALPSEALEPCEADDYLLAGGVIQPLILEVALYSPHTLARPLARCHKEAAEEIEKLEENWRKRGSAYLDEILYALGLALSVAEA